MSEMSLLGDLLGVGLDTRENLEIFANATPVAAVLPPKCGWAYFYHPLTRKCTGVLEAGVGYAFFWKMYCVIFPVCFFLMALTYAHGFTRAIILSLNAPKGRAQRPWYGKTETYVYGLGAIGCLLMGTASIDGFGLRHIYSLRTYLIIFAPAFGLMGPVTIILTAVSLFDTHAIVSSRHQIHVKKSLSIGSVVFMALCVAFGAIGYSVYGWFLADSLNGNNVVRLFTIGNYLTYTSRVLEICCILFLIGPFAVAMHMTAKKQAKRNKLEVRIMSNKVQTWAIRALLLNVMLLTVTLYKDFTGKGGAEYGLLGTMFILMLGRIVELMWLLGTLDLLRPAQGTYVEYVPFEFWYKPMMHKFGHLDSAFDQQGGGGRGDSTTSSDSSTMQSVGTARPRRTDYSRSAQQPSTRAVLETPPKAPIADDTSTTVAEEEEEEQDYDSTEEVPEVEV